MPSAQCAVRNGKRGMSPLVAADVRRLTCHNASSGKKIRASLPAYARRATAGKPRLLRKIKVVSRPQCASGSWRSKLPMNLQPSRTDRGCVRRTSRSVDEGGVSAGRPKGVEACGHAAARATPIAAVRFMVFQCASASRRSGRSMNRTEETFNVQWGTSN